MVVEVVVAMLVVVKKKFCGSHQSHTLHMLLKGRSQFFHDCFELGRISGGDCFGNQSVDDLFGAVKFHSPYPCLLLARLSGNAFEGDTGNSVGFDRRFP